MEVVSKVNATSECAAKNYTKPNCFSPKTNLQNDLECCAAHQGVALSLLGRGSPSWMHTSTPGVSTVANLEILSLGGEHTTS